MAKKRGHGEGSIYKRESDGRWTGSIVVGRDENGKRRNRVVYGSTRKEVADKLARLQNEKLDGTLQAVTKTTVAELIDHSLKSWGRNLQATSRARYEMVARLHINPRIGGVPIDRVRSMTVDNLLDALRDDGVGSRTIQYVFQTLRRAFNLALKRKLVANNPCKAVDAPQVKKREAKFLTTDQSTKLLQETDGTRWHALFVLAITTGLRQGELFGLQWEDVDFENWSISVRHSLEEHAGQRQLKSPKSDAGRRSVSVPAVGMEALQAHRELMMAEGRAASPFVFCNSEGNPLAKANFNHRVWYPLRDKLGLAGVRFHDLRHSSASELIRAGVHMKVIQARLGHSTIKLTMDTYAHLSDRAQEMAADAMQQAFGGIQTGKSANDYRMTTFAIRNREKTENPSPQSESQQRVS